MKTIEQWEAEAMRLADRLAERSHIAGQGLCCPDGATKARATLSAHLAAYPGRQGGWQTMESAPKDGTEVLAWRDDCGVLLVKWTCWNEFATDKERDEVDEDQLFGEDWFYADFREGGRLDGSEVPTQWRPLPPEPDAAIDAAMALPKEPTHD